MRSTKKFSKN